VEILSTGGTAKHLAEAGLTVTQIASWSGAPEILGGRVKTLTPKVFGAILHDRDNPEHRADIERLGIPPVDLVVVNLYPFEQTIARRGVTIAEAIEQIDIGGPSMLRAAAKNYRHVLPLCSPEMYEDFLHKLEQGEIGEEFRLSAAVAVFATTAAYDTNIAMYLAGTRAGDLEEPSQTPDSLLLDLVKFQDLRYGENPQQHAGFYIEADADPPLEQLQGKELSYNNLLDLDSAQRLAYAFNEPACAIPALEKLYVPDAARIAAEVRRILGKQV
jgi:phosphoribosylaminoimidazolecarboxamide formyltransferase/IMP cyclohydrolase